MAGEPWPQRPAVAEARRVCGLGVGDHVAADSGRHRDPVLPSGSCNGSRTWRSLARASLDDVLAHWSGLGYYSRARNLHRAACILSEHHGGRFPRTVSDVMALPGIGRSTAAAIMVFGFGERHAILDGNVKRVLARVRAIEGYPGSKPVADRLWEAAERLLPRKGRRSVHAGLDGPRRDGLHAFQSALRRLPRHPALRRVRARTRRRASAAASAEGAASQAVRHDDHRT